MKTNWFASRTGIMAVGGIIGAVAVLLQYWGNPANMGICVACFERDIAGGLGWHRAAVVQYLRPEIMGFVLGAFLTALAFREFKPRGGSSSLIRQIEVLEMLRTKRIEPLQVVPVQDVLLEPVSLFQTVDYGDYLMVRAANMKLTICKQDRSVVNVSGGGCPNVPYLAERLIGMRLAAENEPRHYGKTLCGYALQLAWEEMNRRCPG